MSTEVVDLGVVPEAWNKRHLLDIEHLSAAEINILLDSAESFKAATSGCKEKLPLLAGRTCANLFFEPSTRTRTSFSLAARRLGADTIDFSSSGSSLSKGETFVDTAKNIEAMGVDVVVVRHRTPGTPHLLAQNLSCSVINAGDGAHEHPTQGLLDIMTIRERRGHVEGLTVALVGDIAHSRTARSNIWGLKKLGAHVIVCGPSTLVSRRWEELGVEVSYGLDEILPRCDVLNLLRIQFERQSTRPFPSVREYAHSVRHEPRAAGAGPGRHPDHGAGADQSGRGGHARRGRRTAFGDFAPGHQRPGGAHGGAVAVVGETLMAAAKPSRKESTVRQERPILIEGGRVIDPSQQMDRMTNLLIEDGRIAGYDALASGDEDVINAHGKIVAPGLIDMHVHLREPGREEDETIDTGTAAALAGGFTSIACIPNTEPPIDTQATVEFIQHQAARADHCNVFVVACVSKNREGKELAELGQLVAGRRRGLQRRRRPGLRRRVDAAGLRILPDVRQADPQPRRGPRADPGRRDARGPSVAGAGSARHARVAEDVMTSRDIALADATGGRVHVMHVSTAGSVDLIRRAKRRGVRVTTEVCPHHFTLTDECLRTFDSNYKMSPPLRSQTHVEACIAGLVDGTIDVICTDHAPHAQEKKMRELDLAPFGIVGLETALGLVATQLIEPGISIGPRRSKR